MKGIKIVCNFKPAQDGYGTAAREFCMGLLESGFKDFSLRQAFEGDYDMNKVIDAKDIFPYEDKDIEYDTILQILTADNIPYLIEDNKRNIIYTMWETTKLPQHWPELLNQMDLVIVPSIFCEKIFKQSGVIAPIEIIPIPTNVDKFNNIILNNEFVELLKDKLIFYYIFQWSERKNPTAILNAYYSHFGSEDDVMLVIKSHITGNDTDKLEIENKVKNIRNDIKRNTNDYPKVIIIADELDANQIGQIHNTCDILVAPTRGEGYGLPIFDAMLAGNHVITTNFSSHVDFTDTYNLCKYQTYDLIDYQLEHVHSIKNSLYTADQLWASINVHKLSDMMVYRYKEWKRNSKVLPGAVARKSHSDYLKKNYLRKDIAKKLLEVCEG